MSGDDWYTELPADKREILCYTLTYRYGNSAGAGSWWSGLSDDARRAVRADFERVEASGGNWDAEQTDVMREFFSTPTGAAEGSRQRTV